MYALSHSLRFESNTGSSADRHSSMRSTVPVLLLLLLAVATSFRHVTGAMCTVDEVAETDQLFLDAASYTPCAPLADTTATPADINFSCADLECATHMRVMVDTVPDCHYTPSVNKKQELNSALKKCDYCSNDQQNEITELFDAAAADAACATSASAIGDPVYMYWICGTSCQSVMEDLAAKMPDCTDADGYSQKASLQKFVTACHALTTSGTGQEISSSSSSSASGNNWPSFRRSFAQAPT